jgi:FAD/FMN-containing dehydrogenase
LQCYSTVRVASIRSVDALLARFEARMCWRKLHFLTPDRLRALYPEAEEFIAVRRQLDPEGVFLNDHLAQLFA